MRIGDTSPFVVRAHHTRLLWFVLYLGDTPEMLERRLHTAATGPLKRLTGYAKDVFGETAESSRSVGRAMAAYLQAFIDLPSDYPVEFSATRKDGVCNSCAIGAHCDKFRRNFDGDAEWVLGLAKTAASLGLTTQTTLVTVRKLPVAGVRRKSLVPTTLTTTVAKTLVSDRLLPVRSCAFMIDVPLRRLWVRRQEAKRMGW